MGVYTEKEICARWKQMFNRCGNQENYKDVLICDEWFEFNEFKKWFIDNEYGSKQWMLELDKDLFGLGERIYSPKTCCLLPKSINTLIASCNSRNGLLPGVRIAQSGRFISTISFHGRKIKRVFETEDDAFTFYKNEKERIIKISAEAYRDVIPKNIYIALMNFEVNKLPRSCKNPENYNQKYEIKLLQHLL